MVSEGLGLVLFLFYLGECGFFSYVIGVVCILFVLCC